MKANNREVIYLFLWGIGISGIGCIAIAILGTCKLYFLNKPIPWERATILFIFGAALYSTATFMIKKLNAGSNN